MTAATRIVVTEPPGEPTAVALYADGIDEPLASIALGPADAVRVASDLLNAARRRMGRPADTLSDDGTSHQQRSTA